MREDKMSLTKQINDNYAGWTPEQWQKFGSTGGTVGKNNKLTYGSLSASDISNYNPDDMSFDYEPNENKLKSDFKKYYEVDPKYQKGLAADRQMTFGDTTDQKLFDYGNIYKGKDGSIMQSTFGSDEAINMADLNKFGLENPEAISAAAEQGDFNKLTFDDQGLQEGLPKEEGTDWGMDGYGGLALGVGNLGLGVASYLENKKTAELQRNLLEQKYGSNVEEMARKKRASSALNKAFANR